MITSNVLQYCNNLPTHDFAAGEVLLTEGDPSSGRFFILVSGVVDILKEGGVSISKISEPGSPIGEMSLLVGTPVSATVRAVTPTRCVVVENGHGFLVQTPQVLLAVAQLLGQRLYAATAYLADIQRQYAGSQESLKMVDTVLSSLIHKPSAAADSESGSDREADPNIAVDQ